jgi:RNA polymerase sigma-70 factor (ECF subfamily)
MSDPAAGPEQRALQEAALNAVRRVIEEELTERQREALVAAKVGGMPLEEIARRMDTNRNALYKLIYDARQRLKQGLVDDGLSPDEVLAAFE